MGTFILLAVVAIVLIFIFMKGTGASEIASINNLVQKDRSVCDYINNLPGWAVGPYGEEGIKIVINAHGAGTYNLYITYNGIRPTTKQFKDLHYKLTNSTSPIMKAHKLNMPYDLYIARNNK